MTLPIVETNGAPVKVCDCDAKLADLTRAAELNNGMLEDMRRRYESLDLSISEWADKMQQLIDAVNNLGQHSQVHTDQVNNIATQFQAFGASLAAMGPAGMLKMVMGKKGKEDG